MIETSPPASRANCQDAGSGRVELVQEGSNALVMQVDAATAGWVVLADQWYPGWKATIDGQPVAIERADYLFKAVRIEAGVHRVALRYSPTSFWAGAAVSFGMMAGLLVYGVWSRSRQ